MSLSCCYELEILLWYYARPVDHEDINLDPPVWATTIRHLRADGLLDQREATDTTTGSCYRITERGRAHVEALLARPLPVQQWVAP